MQKATVRDFLGLMVLSIAIAACGDDGSGGGGSGGSSAALADQCVSEPDATLVSSGALIAAGPACNDECLDLLLIVFNGDRTDASKEAAASCMRDCIIASESGAGVSNECAQCQGDSAACATSSGCFCIDRTSCLCVDCLERSGCQAALDTCTGVTYDFTCTN
jgi:hypothetical protein